jgi:2'-5' RNA ligase
MMRLFVGLRFPDAIQESLKTLCCGLPGAKWVNPKGFHITLRFLGEVQGHLAEDIDAALAEIKAKPFSIKLSGVGQFGPPEKAHTVWAGVARSDALYHLRDKVESAIVRAGGEPDHRRFTPHVSVGKLKNTPQEWLETYLVQNSNFKTPEILVDEFVMFSSHAGDQGRLYLPEVVYPLT